MDLISGIRASTAASLRSRSPSPRRAASASDRRPSISDRSLGATTADLATSKAALRRGSMAILPCGRSLCPCPRSETNRVRSRSASLLLWVASWSAWIRWASSASILVRSWYSSGTIAPTRARNASRRCRGKRGRARRTGIRIWRSPVKRLVEAALLVTGQPSKGYPPGAQRIVPRNKTRYFLRQDARCNCFEERIDTCRLQVSTLNSFKIHVPHREVLSIDPD